MTKSYSIAEARNRRHGQTVAVILSWQEYLRLSAKKDFWDSYNSFREVFDLSELAIEPETFDGVRDLSPGREVDL